MLDRMTSTGAARTSLSPIDDTSDVEGFEFGGLSQSLTVFIPDETFGSPADYSPFIDGPSSYVLRDAIAFAERLSDDVLSTQVDHLLHSLKGGLHLMSWNIVDIPTMPSLRPHTVDDGSLLFEWVLPNFRIGFNVERNPSESGWFMASSQALGDIGASGFIANGDLLKLVFWLLTYLVLHSS